jgi:N-acyl-D-aspartate/D-glutamate deacylase
VPNRDTWGFGEKRAENKTTRTTAKPEVTSQDLGKIIFPSENLEIAQKTIQAVSPKTRSRPLEISTGMFVKGKQNKGNNTTTKNNDKKDNLSNIFAFILVDYTMPQHKNATTILC